MYSEDAHSIEMKAMQRGADMQQVNWDEKIKEKNDQVIVTTLNEVTNTLVASFLAK